MNRTRWLILLGIVLALVLCCCLVSAGLSGFILYWSSTSPDLSASSVHLAAEPPLPREPIQRPATPAERETAQHVAATYLPQRDLPALALRLQGLSLPAIESSADAEATYDLDDTEVFWLHNAETNTFYTTTATLRYETPHAYWWIEDGYPVLDKDLELSARRFEDDTYPTNQRYFGREWNPGIDGDPHVFIFLGNVPGVGGYFSGPDEYPVQIRPYSNEHEMFYVNLDNATPGTSYFDGILAHEHQHMIHWASDRNEDTWVNEGLSELAGLLNGYDVGGSETLFGLNPDTQLTAWPELDESGPHYGASFLFLAYFLEQYGEDALKQLVSEPANGTAGFGAVLAGRDSGQRRFDDLFADWVVANLLDDPALLRGRYGYADVVLNTPQYAARFEGYPARQKATVHQYAADYVLLEGRGDLTIEFSGDSVVSLLGNESHSGQVQWWSNRGDEGDATLTRAFDLTGLEVATFQAWMWYDLETDYDYAYVEVSDDGGETWDLLANEHTTDSNPSGNSYGPGLTGLSGGGDEPQWVQETFDLSRFTGGTIMVRFEVVTDESVNHPGFALDDISIPELGYAYDVEQGEDSWHAEGWVRITAHIPQHFVVQLITIGRETLVERMHLDEGMHGTLTVDGLGRGIDRAIVVVSALAPATTEAAAYSLQITPR